MKMMHKTVDDSCMCIYLDFLFGFFLKFMLCRLLLSDYY